jgi:superfamily II RNA helicase
MNYDPFQLRAIEAIDAEKSVLVSAPTGAGKTAIAEYAITKALSRNERVIYTAPIKALSNQKYRDFSSQYPDQVGLLTGDVSLNSHAPLVIMTTEIYRNQLFEDPERLKNTTWVIFDEVHYLDDPERGTVWEEAIMFSPPHVRFIALSATAPNIEELAEWIRSILDHPIEVIQESHRPVPLVHLFQCQGKIFHDERTLKKEGFLNQDGWPSFRHDRNEGHRRAGHKRWEQHLRAKPNRIDDLIRHLLETKRLPALYFAFGRKRAEELAWEQQKFNFLTPEETTKVLKHYDELCDKFQLTAEAKAIDMRKLIAHGIAFHHAGMLPTLKEVIEQLFTSKQIMMIFTTETFAIGINMPAKTVIFDELRKFYGTHFGFLRTRDYFQMAGRAGRRGMDKEGYVYSRINPHDIRHSTLVRIIFGKQEPIESQFNSCYATLLNLYNQFGQKLLDFYPRSFHFFQSNRKKRERGVGMIERKLTLLKEMGFLNETGLTPKGDFGAWMYGYELPLSEMMESGFLETLDEVKLSVLLCALIYEPRRNQEAKPVPHHLVTVENQAVRVWRKINKLENIHRTWPLTKEAHFHMARALEAWIKGMPFSDMEKYTDIDEGEVIRYFRMVIQLLRQIKQAPQASPYLKATAQTALGKINRDLVDAEKQLKNM